MSSLKQATPTLKSIQRLVATLIGENTTKVDRSRLQPMNYPWTRTSFFVQYPYKHEYNNSVLYRTMIWCTIAAAPLWLWVTRKVCSPENYLAMEQKHHEDHVKQHKKEWEI